MTTARLRAIVLPVAFVLTLSGFIGFLAPFAVLSGSVVSDEFEWPVGVATGVEKAADGSYVVPLDAPGRIQVYDQSWRFVRGWQVDAAGGSFVVDVDKRGNIVTLIERGDMRDVFTPTGELVSSTPFDRNAIVGPLVGGRASHVLLTKPYLFPLWSPGIAWLMGAVGMGLVAAMTLGLSTAPAALLTRLGLDQPEAPNTSQPSYWLVVIYGLSVLIGLFMAYAAPGTIARLFIGAIIVSNAVQLPRLIWGFEIRSSDVRVWFPFTPSLECVLTPEELVAAYSGTGLMRSFTITPTTGRRVSLTAIGTSHFSTLVQHVESLRTTA